MKYKLLISTSDQFCLTRMIFSDILGRKKAEVSKSPSRDMHTDIVYRKKLCEEKIP
jgi:hypothetical protein